MLREARKHTDARCGCPSDPRCPRYFCAVVPGAPAMMPCLSQVNAWHTMMYLRQKSFQNRAMAMHVRVPQGLQPPIFRPKIVRPRGPQACGHVLGRRVKAQSSTHAQARTLAQASGLSHLGPQPKPLAIGFFGSSAHMGLSRDSFLWAAPVPYLYPPAQGWQCTMRPRAEHWQRGDSRTSCAALVRYITKCPGSFNP